MSTGWILTITTGWYLCVALAEFSTCDSDQFVPYEELAGMTIAIHATRTILKMLFLRKLLFQVFIRFISLCECPCPAFGGLPKMRSETTTWRDDCLPCAYLWAAAMYTCLHIPMQLNSTRFLFSALAPSLTGLSFSDGQGCERR